MTRVIAIAVVAAACSPPSRRAGGDAAPPPPIDAAADDDACIAAAAARSSIGCEYWPVDLPNAVEYFYPQTAPNSCFVQGQTLPLEPVQIELCVSDQYGFAWGLCDYDHDCSALAGAGLGTFTCKPGQPACVLDARHSKFAVVASNPDATTSVDVTLTDAAGNTATTTIAPGGIATMFPQQLGFPDHSLVYSGVEKSAYRLVSTRPIVAYQFNPLDNQSVFSNGASLLLPTSALDTKYYAMTYATWTNRPSAQDWPGYVTIVATAPGTTNVAVAPTARVVAGAGVPALAAGTMQTFALDQFDTLTLEAPGNGLAAQSPGDDLTGTLVTADQPIAAYGGHAAAGVSNDGAPPCCKDHLEEQLFPTSTWGKDYLVAHTHSDTSFELVRVLAQKPGTTVTFDPPLATPACTLPIDAGQFCEAWIWQDTHVTASAPVLVGHYMPSYGNNGADGDPALALVVPVEQFRTDYEFLVPMYYAASRVLVASSGEVTIDGAVVAAMTAVGSSGYRAARVDLAAGAHRITCPDGCAAEVAVWDVAVASMFPAGIMLQQIVIE